MMTQDEIDTMWSIALQKAIEENQPYTRYAFAKLVAAAAASKEREQILAISAKQWFKSQHDLEEAIRARGEA